MRFYGTTVQVEDKPMFLVTGADFSKKRDPIDQEFLNAVGKTALGLNDSSNDRQKK